MTQRLLLLVVSLWLSLHSSTSAQVDFRLPFVNNVTPGTYLTLPVRATGFDSVVSLQFVIRWDPAVLSFVQIVSFNLPPTTFENFGLAQAQDSGLIRFTWSTQLVQQGVSIPDTALLFRIMVQAIGEVNESTSVIFTSHSTTEFELVQAGYPPYNLDSCTVGDNCSLTNGFVAIGYTVSTYAPDNETFPVKISPNPFSGSTRAFFTLEKDEEVQMLVTDALGSTVMEKKISLPPGEHGMEIVSDQLQENGIYYLIIRTATGSCIRSLVKL